MSSPVSVHEDAQVARIVRDLALEGFEGPSKPTFMSHEKYRWLRDVGSRLWLDTGDIAAAEKIWSIELEALTTNNTLVNQVVQTGAMDGLISYAARKMREARSDMSDHDLVVEIAFLVNARLALGLVQKLGAHVSVELHPDVGFDVARTVSFARRYYEINPDYFYIKAPLTPDGFVSARQLSSEGIPVNYTLGFSARQNYLAARFSQPRFVNVFLGRLNQLVEENGIGRPKNIGEKAALASYEAVRSLRRAHPGLSTEQIAASMRNGQQVATLAGIDVLTIPPKVAADYLEMDVRKDEIRRYRSEELMVHLDLDSSLWAAEMDKLWVVDERFMAFVEDAVSQANKMTNGRSLVSLSNKHEVALFHDWTEDDRRKIREHGKIPDLSQWDAVPIDDLMSMSALESFAKDQQELDDRIEGLIPKS